MTKSSIKRIGILILSNTWGGAEESVYKIASYIDKRKFKVFLLVNEFLYDKYIKIPEVTTINLGKLESNKKLGKLKTLFLLQQNFKKSIEDNQINLIHAQLENTILMLALGGLPNTPLVFTLRGEETSIYLKPRTIEHFIIRFFMHKLFISNKVTITSVSTWLRNQYPEKEKAKIVVCVNGVDTNIFRPRKVVKYKNSILYVGRYAEEKGVDDLIEVAKSLSNCRFLFVGTGPLEKLITLKNTTNLGFKSRDEICKLYNKATICAFPTTFPEGMPNVGLEALASGATIVASKIGFSEIIDHGHNGMIIAPGSKHNLLNAIKKLLKDHKLRKRLSKNARIKGMKYDIRKTIKNYEVVYLKSL